MAEIDAPEHNNLSDGEDGMSSGDSGLLKDINENLKDRKDDSFEEHRERDLESDEEMKEPQKENSTRSDINEFNHRGYLQEKGDYYHSQQSDLSALQKLYSLESMQRFKESSSGALFPTNRDPLALPSYDKPLMIDVGPGRSFSASHGHVPGMMDSQGVREVDKVKKKAVVREAVDPAKYVRVQDLEGIKFACSKCGNIYKWRKSLNKHWKEKHDGEIPNPVGQSMTMLNIPQVKGKTTNINTALFSYAPLPAPPRPNAQPFHGMKMPGVPAKIKETDFMPGYPSAEMLSKYEALSKQWMNFTHASVGKPQPLHNNGVGITAQDAVKNVRSASREGDKSGNSLVPGSAGIPLPSSTPSSRVTTPQSGRASVEMSYAHAAAAAMVAAQHPFLMVPPPPPAHSHGYKPPMPALPAAGDVGDDAPLDLSKDSKSSSSKPGILDLSGSKSSPEPALDYPGDRVKKEILDNNLYSRTYDYADMKKLSASTCAVCTRSFQTISDLNEHFAIFHIDVIYEKTFSYGIDTGMKDGTYSCIVCNASYLYQGEIKQHFEKNHPTLPNPYKKRASPGSLVGEYMTEPPSKY